MFDAMNATIISLEPNKLTLSPLTQAQIDAEEQIEQGLDFPVQGKGLQHGKFILPIWTDGDGCYYAIGRNGEIIPIQ